MKYGSAPLVEAAVEVMLVTRDRVMEILVDITISGIESTISDHFEILFRDMLDQAFYKLHDVNGLFYVRVIFMTIVMESNLIPIIFVNAGGGNDWSAQVSSNIFCNDFGIAFIGFGIDVETLFMIPIAGSFGFLKRRTENGFHFIKESGAESISEICVVKMLNVPPEAIITVSTF